MIKVSSTIRIITILLIISIFYNCNRSVDISKVEITFNNEEMFFKKNSKPFTGTINEYYDNGKTKMEMFVLKGLKHGSFNQFHTNGNLQTQSNFIKGEIHGKFTSYFESGNEQIVTFYRYNNRNGSYEEFHENGKLKICGNYYKGKRIGEFYEFFKSGGIAIYNY